MTTPNYGLLIKDTTGRPNSGLRIHRCWHSTIFLRRSALLRYRHRRPRRGLPMPSTRHITRLCRLGPLHPRIHRGKMHTKRVSHTPVAFPSKHLRHRAIAHLLRHRRTPRAHSNLTSPPQPVMKRAWFQPNGPRSPGDRHARTHQPHALLDKRFPVAARTLGRRQDTSGLQPRVDSIGAHTDITRNHTNCLTCFNPLNSSSPNFLRNPTRHNYLPVDVAHSPLDRTSGFSSCRVRHLARTECFVHLMRCTR